MTGGHIMTGIEKVDAFLNKVPNYCFLTADGNQPKGRPFGFHLVADGKIYFGTGTFKSLNKQILKNPQARCLR